MNSLPQKTCETELSDGLDPCPTASGERQNLADALAHERNVLRTMIDLIPAFIYAKDAHSRFTACNELVARRMGVSPEQALGKTDFDFFPKEMAEKFFNDEQALIKSGEPMIGREEIAFDKTRGMDRVILTSKMPLRDAQGNLTGIVGTGYDITERKAAEARLASMDRHESIGRLAAGVAHEINTPIQYLKDSVSFVQEVCRNCWNTSTAARRDAAAGRTRRDVESCRRVPPALKLMADGLSRIG